MPKAIKEHFKSVTRHGIMTNRKFWATIRPFLTNKGMTRSNEISHKQGGGVVNNEGNVLENTAGKKPLSVLHEDNVSISTVINTSLEECKYHPSVSDIRNTLKKQNVFLFLK